VSACDPPADDDPTTFAVTSTDPASPNVILGCIDSSSDTDSYDLSGQSTSGTTGIVYIKCFAATGLVEFDTPAVTPDWVACTPGGSGPYGHQSVVSTDVLVRPQGAGSGGDYRLEMFLA
jgi:hypothetical protein